MSERCVREGPGVGIVWDAFRAVAPTPRARHVYVALQDCSFGVQGLPGDGAAVFIEATELGDTRAGKTAGEM